MWFRNAARSVSQRSRLALATAAICAVCVAFPAMALLAPWLGHIVAGTAAEAALFRRMEIPGGTVFFPRPPAESVAELDRLPNAGNDPSLLLLRSHQEESALDLTAAEHDLRAYAAREPGDPAAQLALADFYHRRLAVNDEFDALLAAGKTPLTAAGSLANPLSQAPWQAFERALRLVEDQSLPPAAGDRLWAAWLARYPQQPTLYGRAFTWNLNADRAPQAAAILAHYRQAFPAEPVFPVKADALLALHAGSSDGEARALTVYDAAFSPLWPKDLVDSYFDLLAATHSTRRFVAAAQTRLIDDPQDLNAAARLFLLQRHEGHPDLAAEALDDFRRAKERKDPAGRNWSPVELNTLAQLSLAAQLYPEAARYLFALYSASGQLADGRPARQAGLTGMISLLLTVPDQPIPLGSANLSLYRNIGTLDRGPSFLNGVLSLWLNGQNIRGEFANEEARARPYFHRSEAAALLALLDQEFPAAPERAPLHAQLIQAYAVYGNDGAVLRAGQAFLAEFPGAPVRTAVALSMAEADARAKDNGAEFAIYDRLLAELGHTAKNMPLTAAAAFVPEAATPGDDGSITVTGTETAGNAAAQADDTGAVASEAPAKSAAAFELNTGNPSLAPNPAALAYAEVLDRYLARLSATGPLPAALTVLRKELDRNPDDQKLYERLASFLAQNNLSAKEEELYRAAIARFGGTSAYDRLARFYLREKRRDAFAALTREVTGIFSGTELERYFAQVREGGPQLFLELNLYAHTRFPHDLTFTQNLLAAYKAKPTADRASWEHLLRTSWWQSPELTAEFFSYLSQTGQLENEIAHLEPLNTSGPNPDAAALTELGQANLWRSHFEQSSPLFDRLAALYPTDPTVDDTAADLNRSLAWLDPAGPDEHIARAVAIEQRLLRADAADANRLIRIGDTLADHANGNRDSYAPAARFWRGVPRIAPGVPGTYLDAATVFWDYYEFDDALAEIHEARAHFNDPVLFGYQTGAVLEGKRDLAPAIREYVAAATAPPEQVSGMEPSAFNMNPLLFLASAPDFDEPLEAGPSAARLLQLARRPATATLVDTATATAFAAEPSLAALRLRLAVLAAQRRKGEEGPLFQAAIARTGTADAVATLAAFAQKQGDTPAYEAALQRQIALTPDPVEKLRLTYDLVASYTARNDLAGASRLVDTTYDANPRVLGVVRSTVDFDWSNKRQKNAIDVLLQAARAAEPALGTRFRAEAAAKANETGDTVLGRSLALSLLAADPYRPQFLTLAAESFSRTGDAAGLARFYGSRLEAIRAGAMTPEERKARAALLRRGLLAAYIAAKDYPAALEQYVALLSAFADDGALVREAALFAQRYGQGPGLLSFYRQTTQSSPRDVRFFIDLAQTEDVLADPAGALEAYASAVALRPERADLYIAKASVEERLQRLDAAVADYTRLFQLTYGDPQWMVAAAQAQVRQGHNVAAVEALKTAYLHGGQTTPHDLFIVAAQLEQWGLIPEAADFSQQGAKAAGSDLLTGQSPAVASDDAATYARVMARSRQTSEVFSTLHAALDAAGGSIASPSALAAQVQSTGLASVTDAEWRRQYVLARQARAASQFTAAVLAMSTEIATYATPEDRAAYATALSAQKAAAPREETAARWLPAAEAADLGDLEGAWRAELLAGPKTGAEAQLSPFIALEGARLRFAELGAALERFIRSHPASDRRAEAVGKAASSYAAEGLLPAEMQLLRAQRLADPANASIRDTYLALLVRRDTNALVALAGDKNEALADAAVATALAAAPQPIALAAVRAHGASESPVWSDFYTGLAGLYLGDTSAAIDTSFRGALAPDATIAERLGAHPDPTHVLSGDQWFYAAGRYGEWRLLTKTSAAQAEDVLPADLERAPVPANYLALAQTEAEAGHLNAALAETDHALELSPASVDALDERADLLWRAGRRPEAVDCWRTALASLRSVQENGPAPEAFWTGFARMAARVKRNGLFEQLAPAMAELLRSYLARNGTYRSNELLRAAVAAAPDQTTSLNWLLGLTAGLSDAAPLLRDLEGAGWLSAAGREILLARELSLLETQMRGLSASDDRTIRLNQVRARLTELYIADRKDAEALALVRAAPASARAAPALQEAALIGEGRLGTLGSTLQGYDAQPASIPQPETIRLAAAVLAADGALAAANTLLAWNFARAEAAHALAATDFLALAEARLHTGDSGGAVELLRSLVTTSSNRYEDEDSAATLLENAHREAEAIAFLQELANGVPWEAAYRVRLAEAQLAASVEVPLATAGLRVVARSSLAPYALRAKAARDLAGAHAGAGDLGSAELTLLASGSAVSTVARQPFFVEARVAAAGQEPDPKRKLALVRETIAIAPHAPGAEALRLQAFELSAQTGQPALARAVLEGLLAHGDVSTGPLPSRATRNAGPLASLLTTDAFTAPGAAVPHPPLPTGDALFSPAAQSALAEQVAQVYAATGAPDAVRPYLQFARDLLPTDAAGLTAKAHIAAELAQLEAGLRRAAANAARRPSIGKQLDQPRIVRVRLTAAAGSLTLDAPAPEEP